MLQSCHLHEGSYLMSTYILMIMIRIENSYHTLRIMIIITVMVVVAIIIIMIILVLRGRRIFLVISLCKELVVLSFWACKLKLPESNERTIKNSTGVRALVFFDQNTSYIIFKQFCIKKYLSLFYRNVCTLFARTTSKTLLVLHVIRRHV